LSVIVPLPPRAVNCLTTTATGAKILK